MARSNCGDIFCGDCTSKSAPILQLGFDDPVRVCDKCHAELCAPYAFCPHT